jgi:hypothetical protein
MIYTLENIRYQSIINNPVKYSKVIDGSKWDTHKLENNFSVRLSNGAVLKFNEGWTWDRASVPQLFHSLIRPDGDDDIAYVIHDELYKNKKTTRKFADKEMLRWARVMKGTSRWSLRNIDINLRYLTVRLFGGFVWNKK